ncbi:HEAT repeat domain-containing protein [Synechocystis salina LEGE 06099]|uniref:HEAT repeat domain-containing protein n=1 Tax=Synechocystis salina TaxID=945780 RepID=UPI00188001E2|nr:HEAT repeat domain-containing protein [Synechocystis salina]MBE9203225.1 HEAT repeat domain-containing protein [Synechocystis salina LEGE 06099]
MTEEILRNPAMTALTLEQIASQLDSPNSGDRLIALASLRPYSSEEAVPLIKKVLDDDTLQVRSMAVFALGIKQTEECYPILVKLLETDEDYGIRADAAGALGYLEDERAFHPLCRAFYEDTEWLVRFSAAVALGNLKDLRAQTVLLEALKSAEAVVQQAAIAALGEIGAVEAVDAILAFASHEDWLIRQRLAEALGNLPCDQSRSALTFMVRDEHPQVSQAAQLSLQKLDLPN